MFKHNTFGDLLDWTAHKLCLSRKTLFAANVLIKDVKVHAIYMEDERLTRVYDEDETFIFQTHDSSEITEAELHEATHAKIAQTQQQKILQQKLTENRRKDDKIDEGMRVRIRSTKELGTVTTTYPENRDSLPVKNTECHALSLMQCITSP